VHQRKKCAVDCFKQQSMFQQQSIIDFQQQRSLLLAPMPTNAPLRHDTPHTILKKSAGAR
jgi:hypothetical protein